MIKPKAVIVISGPSAAGKTTLERSLGRHPMFASVVSVTTRQQRPGEIDGQDYRFLAANEYMDLRRTGMLVEDNVFDQQYYGVTIQEVARAFAVGKVPVIVADPNGQAQIESYMAGDGIPVISVFVDCPAREQFIRLVARHDQVLAVQLRPTSQAATEARGRLASRLVSATQVENKWSAAAWRYDYFIKQLNDDNRHAVLSALTSSLMNKLLTIESADPLRKATGTDGPLVLG